jgi:hypothetical protein
MKIHEYIPSLSPQNIEFKVKDIREFLLGISWQDCKAPDINSLPTATIVYQPIILSMKKDNFSILISSKLEFALSFGSTSLINCYVTSDHQVQTLLYCYGVESRNTLFK